MQFFWQKRVGAIRLPNGDLSPEEKLIAEPVRAPRPEDEDAIIIRNLVELHLIDPYDEEKFLREQENRAGRCLDERDERVTSGRECNISSLFIRKAKDSVWSLLLHTLAVVFAVAGRWFLNEAIALLPFKGENVSNNTPVYHRFWDGGAVDILPLLVFPMAWFAVQYFARMFQRSVTPIFSSIYEIVMIVLLTYFPSVPVSIGGYHWQDVLDVVGCHPLRSTQFSDDIDENRARRYALTGFLCAYPIAVIYFVLISTRIIAVIVTLARGTASPGTSTHWLSRHGHTAASGLYFINALLCAVGAGMNIWNGMWYSWHSSMEEITATWSAAGFPLQTVILGSGVLAFLTLCVFSIAGRSLPAKLCRRYSTAMAVVLVYSVLTCSIGIAEMDSEKNEWAARTTKPRHIVAVTMAAIVSLIHALIAICPALTRHATIDEEPL